MVIKILSTALLVASLFGCNSNPYKGVGEVQVEQPAAQRAVEPAIGFASDETYEFAEGQETTYPIIAKVPAGKGTAVITFEGLPAGVTFNAKESKLVWKPSFDDANDPKDPTIREKIYKVKVAISTTGDSLTKMIRYINLKVKDTPRKFLVTVDPGNTITTKEGQSIRAKIKITNEDFPKTEHAISTTDIIPGLTITQDNNDPLSYYIDYTPGYDVVKVGVGNCGAVPTYCSEKITTNISVVSPSGINRMTQVSITVNDSRLLPDVYIPGSLSTYGDTTFEFSVEDPNQEVQPQVNLVQGPKYGTIKIDYRDKFASGSSKNGWSRTVGVSWYNVPPANSIKGNVEIIKFQICNLREQNKVVNCVAKDVPVTVNLYSSVPPEVKRQNWGQKEVKFLREGDSLSFDLPIAAKGVNDSIADVYVLPGNLSREVYWEAGKIWVTGIKPGVKTVSLVVSTQLGGRLSEPFQYEVLPRDWKNTVLVYKYAYDPEASGLKSAVDAIDLDADPTNTRPFQVRKNAIISSSYLSSLVDPMAIDLNVAGVKNVLLFGGSLDKLNGKLLAELKTQGVNLIQPVTTTNTTINIPDYNVEFVLDSVYKAKMTTGYSGGYLTPKVPAVFSLTPSSKCLKLGQLYNPNSASSYTIGIQCQRANGGKIIAFGVALDDVTFDDYNDKQKFTSWILGQLE